MNGSRVKLNSEAVTNTLAALAIGVLQIGVAISLATLIFSGPLSDGAGRAAASFLLGTVVVSGLVGATTRMSVVSAGTQDTAAVVVAAVATSVAAAPSLTSDEAVPTVMVMIALATLTTGVTFWLLGRFGLSTFVRFLPYPVISGFTVGTGWLLFRGGVAVMHGSAIELGDIAELFSWEQFKFLLPGVILIAVMVAVIQSRFSNTIVSIAILGALFLFHAIAQSMTSLDELERDGWLVGPFPEDAGWSPIRPSDLADTNWSVLFDHFIPIMAVVAVSVIGLLLNLSGLENGPDPKIDMNHELTYSGIANSAMSVTGALVGYHLIGDTLLARQLGARGRTVPLTIAAMAFVLFLIGPDLIALVPRAIAGGVLAGIGVTLMISWATTSLVRMHRTDQFLSSLILIAIAVLGVLPGVAVGIVVAAAAFLISYGRIDPVRSTMAAAGRSYVDRSRDDQRFLAQSGDSILAWELHGYLFFGSATRLLTDVETRIAEADASTPCRFIIIDFAHVTGLDSTASTGLATFARQLEETQQATLVWSGLSPNIARQLHHDLDINAHENLDHAIAWCEEQLLAEHITGALTTGPHLAMAPELVQFMERHTLAAGETLMRLGATDRDLYFVISGKLTAWVESADGRPIRLRQVLPGAALGEIAFCTGAARTATVKADTDATVLAMRRSTFDDMSRTNPELAVKLQEELLVRLGSRLSTTTSLVRDLLS